MKLDSNTEETKKQPNIVRPGDGNFYLIDGKRYVRVTHPLSYWVPPALKNWFINKSPEEINQKKTDTAAQGSAIHKKAELGTEDRLSTLLSQMGATKIASEVVVWSKNGWCGSADLIVDIGGKLHLLDIKSGSAGMVWPQISAYSLAANEQGMNIEGIGMISLPRDESKDAKYFDYTAHMEEGQIQWCELFDVWKWSNYKQLAGWEFLKGRSVFSYNWSDKAKHGE